MKLRDVLLVLAFALLPLAGTVGVWIAEALK